jgi:hypothetical protein
MSQSLTRDAPTCDSFVANVKKFPTCSRVTLTLRRPPTIPGMRTRKTYPNPSQCLMILLALLWVSIGADAQTTMSNSSKPNRGISTAKSQAGVPTLTPSSFGFECGPLLPTNCPNETWPATIAQPGMIRLWDSQVQWHLLNPAPGKYRWTVLDAYLDAIAVHQPRDVMYTFGYTPCWDTKGACEGPRRGSIYPPSDLTTSGSSSFNTFVAALIEHCSSAGHCVKDYIKYWEMWNEANAPQFWGGTIAQLYELMAPAIAIVRNKLPGAVILTPAVNRADVDWMRGWLNEENTKGRLSDIFSIHLYLQDVTPEKRFNRIKQMVELKNETSGWSNAPWMNTETNFDARTFACGSSYTPEECIGQLVRWHLLHYAYGAQNVNWFFFNTTIGRNTDYSNAYHAMMDWLVGGHFTAECSASGSVYTCPFVEGNGHHAMLVWNASGNSSYIPASPYSDYKDLSGGTTTMRRGQPVSIGVKPIMLEAAD